MIYIYTVEQDSNVNPVMDWLRKCNIDHERINGTDFYRLFDQKRNHYSRNDVHWFFKWCYPSISDKSNLTGNNKSTILTMYKLSTNCIPVRGYSRSILYNLSLRTYDYIPNSLYDLLQKKPLISQWIDLTQKQNETETIFEYIDFLVKNNYVIKCNSENEKCFIPLKRKEDSPEKITSVTLNIV